MSGSFDKRSDGAARRQARIQKEQKEKRKIRIITVSVVIVLALLFIGALFLNSKVTRRNITAVTVGGVSFTPVEFDYFLNTAYQEYKNMVNEQMGSYASSMLPSTTSPLTSQIFDEDTGQTWADYIYDYAIIQMSELVQYFNEAKAAGYVLPDDERETMNSQITDFKQYIELFQSFDAYIQGIYGSNINESSFRRLNEFITTATSYSKFKHDSFTYSTDEKVNYYHENRDTLDVFTYRYFIIYAETVTQADYDTDEAYDAAKEAALADASEKAALIAAEIVTEEDFINAARDLNESQYIDADSTLHSYPGSWLGSYYGPWLRESERAYGDVTTADMTSGTYVVFFNDRDNNNYNMTEMRQILMLREKIDPEDYEEGEEDPAYLEAIADADVDAAQRAEAAYEKFLSDGATEAALMSMMEEYSDDSTEGGFYSDISKNPNQNKMVKEIEDWLFEDGRQYGDYAMIQTEDYGYHLVFFMGFGENCSEFLADDEMRDNDYSAWKESLPAVEATKHWAFILTSQDISAYNKQQ